jgi:sRNA-binding carbon storage regulator CsrA
VTEAWFQAVHEDSTYLSGKEAAMLKLTLTPDEYLLINNNIVLKLTDVVGERVYLAMDAPKEVPIVRGTVLEREGGTRPACLTDAPSRERRKL